MPRQTLTTSFVNSLSNHVPEKGSVCFFDTEIKGFFLELRASGTATYYFRYRNEARKLRLEHLGRAEETILADARTKAHKMKQMLKEGGDPRLEAHRLKDIPTFADFVRDRYLPYIKVRKRSWDSDEILLRNHLIPPFGEFKMNRITRSDVVSFHHSVKEKGYAAGTCNRILVLMKYIFNCAIRWDIMPPKSNPCVGVEMFEDHGARERYLTQEEVKRLFEELGRSRHVQVANVIKLLLYTGARKREILDARWDCIDFSRRILTVPISKSGKPRYIALSDAAITLLKSLPRQEDIPWVFFNPKTKKPPVSIFCAWNTLRKKAGIPEVRLHDLRHSFASFLVNSGRSLYEVQKLLGHYDPKVTMRYAHLSPGALIDAVNVVGNVVGKGIAG